MPADGRWDLNLRLKCYYHKRYLIKKTFEYLKVLNID
jgi:hypothetical protein